MAESRIRHIASGACSREKDMTKRRIERIGKSVILYDASLVSQISESLFDPDRYPGAPEAPGYAGGRGSTLFIRHADQDWVLRHYHRGGFMGRWLDDQFVWLGLKNSRPYREYLLLEELARRELPSPIPVAARVLRRGLIYSADLITLQIPDVLPLSTRLASDGLADGGWRDVGRLIGRFHRENIFHADLTAHNLQIDSEDRLYLLDFDRGKVMAGPGSWSDANLQRLHRSLRKISLDGSVSFGAREWQALTAGYSEIYSLPR